MDHYNPFFLSFFIYACQIKTLRQIHIKLDCGHLPFASGGVFGHEVELWSIQRCFTQAFKEVRTSFVRHISKLTLRFVPYLGSSQIFFRSLRVPERKPHPESKAESFIESINNIPDLQKFFPHLIVSAKDMGIVLGY